MNIKLLLALSAAAVASLSSCASTGTDSGKKCCGTDGKCCHECSGGHDHSGHAH